MALKLPAEHATRALKALALAEGERRAAMGRIPEEVQTALPQLAFDAGDMTKARAYAEQLLARSQGEDWIHSWTGEAVHRGNMVLGRIAVREGKLTEAITFLRRSGDAAADLTSPGPNMSLAKDLLEAGETAAVLAYFEQCRRFWKQMPASSLGSCSTYGPPRSDRDWCRSSAPVFSTDVTCQGNGEVRVWRSAPPRESVNPES